jgi:hypothetical protein
VCGIRPDFFPKSVGRCSFDVAKKLGRARVSEVRMQPSALAHSYNPSYRGDRDQEDCCWRLAWVKS